MLKLVDTKFITEFKANDRIYHKIEDIPKGEKAYVLYDFLYACPNAMLIEEWIEAVKYTCLGQAVYKDDGGNLKVVPMIHLNKLFEIIRGMEEEIVVKTVVSDIALKKENEELRRQIEFLLSEKNETEDAIKNAVFPLIPKDMI